jgi:hypothetical protein
VTALATARTTAPVAPPDPALSPAPADPATLAHPGRWRLTQVAICFAVASLPLLRPAGPGNTGLVDLGLLGAMLACALWASARSHRIQLPYAVPVALTVVAGAVALTVGGGAPGAAGRGLLALLQDVFVFAWAAAVATVGRDRRMLDTLCRAWAYSTTAWAAVLIIGDAAGIDWITGITARDGIRASLTLGDPNLAADYFLVGLLVMRAVRRPRRAGWRWFACALTVTAIVLTLSNGGILALLVATMLGALFRLARRGGPMIAVTLGATVLVAGGLALVSVDVHGWVTQVEQSSPLVRDSLGREAESGGSRTTLAYEGLNLWLHGDSLLGVGPSNTESTLRARQAPYIKESHDDYLAALLERGLLGGVALVLLGAALGIRARRISRPGGVAPDYLAVVPRPELLAAAAVAVGISAMFYETLHFRHVWALLGLIAALELTGRRRAARAAATRNAGPATGPAAGSVAGSAGGPAATGDVPARRSAGRDSTGWRQ